MGTWIKCPIYPARDWHINGAPRNCVCYGPTTVVLVQHPQYSSAWWLLSSFGTQGLMDDPEYCIWYLYNVCIVTTHYIFRILHNLYVYELFQILLLFCQPFGSMECVCVFGEVGGLAIVLCFTQVFLTGTTMVMGLFSWVLHSYVTLYTAFGKSLCTKESRVQLNCDGRKCLQMKLNGFRPV